MNIKAKLRSGVCVVAICAGVTAAPMAQADFVPGSYAVGSQQFNLSIGGSPGAGGFQGLWNGNTIYFWCIELTQFFSPGTHYTNQYTPSLATNTLLSKLFTEAYGSALSNATNSAAFQLAIWEIIYDSGDLHLNGGAFKVLGDNGHSATVTIAQGWLDGLTGASAGYTLYFLTAPGNQDFVTASRIPVPTTKVPEPGSLALLTAALLAAGFVRARATRRFTRVRR